MNQYKILKITELKIFVGIILAFAFILIYSGNVFAVDTCYSNPAVVTTYYPGPGCHIQTMVSEGITTKFSYSGYVDEVINPVDPSQSFKYKYYPAIGNIKEVRSGTGIKAFVQYDSKGYTSSIITTIDGKQIKETFKFNPTTGLLEEHTLPNRKEEFTYNSGGELMKKDVKSYTDSKNFVEQITRITYDVHGNIIKISPSDQPAKAYTYNNYPFPCTICDPLDSTCETKISSICDNYLTDTTLVGNYGEKFVRDEVATSATYGNLIKICELDSDTGSLTSNCLSPIENYDSVTGEFIGDNYLVYNSDPNYVISSIQTKPILGDSYMNEIRLAHSSGGELSTITQEKSTKNKDNLVYDPLLGRLIKDTYTYSNKDSITEFDSSIVVAMLPFLKSFITGFATSVPSSDYNTIDYYILDGNLDNGFTSSETDDFINNPIDPSLTDATNSMNAIIAAESNCVDGDGSMGLADSVFSASYVSENGVSWDLCNDDASVVEYGCGLPKYGLFGPRSYSKIINCVNGCSDGACIKVAVAAPSCSDGIMNQGEAGIDCNGNAGLQPCPDYCTCISKGNGEIPSDVGWGPCTPNQDNSGNRCYTALNVTLPLTLCSGECFMGDCLSSSIVPTNGTNELPSEPDKPA